MEFLLNIVPFTTNKLLNDNGVSPINWPNSEWRLSKTGQIQNGVSLKLAIFKMAFLLTGQIKNDVFPKLAQFKMVSLLNWSN